MLFGIIGLIPVSRAVAPNIPAAESGAGAGSQVIPQLSVFIDDAQISATPGGKLSYAITVQNSGSIPIVGLLVTQTLPAGLTFVSADAGGIAGSGKVSWNLDVEVSKTVTVHSTNVVSGAAGDLGPLASVACATLNSGTSADVCATDSDQLPGGAAATTTESSGSNPPWVLLGGVVLVVLALGLLVARRKRISRRGAAGHVAELAAAESDHRAGDRQAGDGVASYEDGALGEGRTTSQPPAEERSDIVGPRSAP